MTESSVDLPQPLGPVIGHGLPGGDDETGTVERGDAPAGVGDLQAAEADGGSGRPSWLPPAGASPGCSRSVKTSCAACIPSALA